MRGSVGTRASTTSAGAVHQPAPATSIANCDARPVIRAAEPSDVPALLELIRELARYEREPDAVHNTEAQLAAVLFGPDPLVHALVAEESGTVVGTAIWFVNYSTWTGRHGLYLEDLFVLPAHRRGGHGRALLVALAGICLERGFGRFEWTVLDWNEPALRFYRSLDAVPMSEWTVQRLTGEALARLAGS
jgi:GNAT superfamily N-acetyltransferase